MSGSCASCGRGSKRPRAGQNCGSASRSSTHLRMWGTGKAGVPATGACARTSLTCGARPLFIISTLSLGTPRPPNTKQRDYWTDVLGAFDNVPFETGGSGQEFLPFFALDAEFIQRCQRMFHKDLPVTFADAESFMRGFHIASAVDDWPPKRLTKKVDC